MSGGMSTAPPLQDVFSPYTPRYFDSGTAALGAAIIAAIKLKGVDVPQVVLPANGCPDLVSAVIFAGAMPVLIDLEPERASLDLDLLSARYKHEYGCHYCGRSPRDTGAGAGSG